MRYILSIFIIATMINELPKSVFRSSISQTDAELHTSRYNCQQKIIFESYLTNICVLLSNLFMENRTRQASITNIFKTFLESLRTL